MTKTNPLVNGRGLPRVLILTTGHAGDSQALRVLLDLLRIPRCDLGHPWTTPDALRGDQAYSAKVHSENNGSRGGRPIGVDPEDDKQAFIYREPLLRSPREVATGQPGGLGSRRGERRQQLSLQLQVPLFRISGNLVGLSFVQDMWG